MQIVRNRLRFYAKQFLQILQRLLKEDQRLEVLQVADMLAENRVASLRQAEGVFQFGSAGEDLLHRHAEIDRLRYIAARPPQHTLASLKGAYDGVIHAHVNVAVMKEEPVGDRAQPLRSFFIGDDDRLFAEVSTRHDQRRKLRCFFRRIAEQQVMKRRVGKHDAEGFVSGSDRRRDCSVC